MERHFVSLGEVRLSYLDYGGTGTVALLLHGLTGRASHWQDTARWLTAHYHVIALDQRGHGQSDKPDGAFTRAHYVTDVIRFIEHLGVQPVVLVGHSMGAQNGLLVAAARPDLVKGLVMIDQRVTKNPEAQRGVQSWFDQWSVPFPTEEAARAFFGGDSLRAQAYLETLVQAEAGYFPEFRFEQMLESIEDQVTTDYWDAVDQVRCPTLVVAGEQTWMPIDEQREVARRLRQGEFALVAGAGHAVYLEQPERWRQAAEPFLAALA